MTFHAKHNNQTQIVKLETPDQADLLIPLLKEFGGEMSEDFPIRFDIDTALASIRKNLEYRTAHVFVTYEREEPSGLLVLTIDNDMSLEKRGTVFAIYATQKFRRTHVPRFLVYLAERAAKQLGAVMLVFDCPQIISSGGGKSFANLLRKRGYALNAHAHRRL